MRTHDATDPINQLYAEHDAALEHLGMLGRAGRGMAERGAEPALLEEYRAAVKFLDEEIRAHNQWEENHLFPLLELYTGPGGPCSVMRAEHRTLWETYAAVGPLVERAQRGEADATQLGELARLSDSIVDLLSAHIQKENEILFPMARRMLRPADLERLRARR